ncbi:MAG: LAGLIDADG family homing endonuclease [Nanoarchaeota archaeon]
MQKELIDLKDFIPKTIVCHEGNGQEVQLNYTFDDEFIHLSYIVNHHNGSCREHSFVFPRFISKSNETFEVLGLLQAEGSKTQRGCFTFCNHEYKLINKVIIWFKRELYFNKENWRWYIKVNINEPEALDYKKDIESKLINYWRRKTSLPANRAYPKIVTYIANTKNKKLKFYDKGTLIIEYKNNLFNNIIQKLIGAIFIDINLYSIESIKSFLKGIIAGEGTIAYHRQSRHYGIHISITKENERKIYKEAFNKLGINLKIYNNYKETLISKRENLVKLLKLRLMTLSPEKYNKFLYMIRQYPDIKYETSYFAGKREPWNKIPQEKINQILELYKSGITRTKDISEKLEISDIKVNRVLKENNLGKRAIKIPEEKRKEISKFAKENTNLTQKQIAKQFGVSQMAVQRACVKYSIRMINKSQYKIQQEKIIKIIQLYKENPTVKFSEIRKELGISDSVIKRVRKENNLTHLGYKYLIGCNNPKNKILSQETRV